MVRATPPVEPAIIEPVFVPDIFAHKLARTETVGPDLFRFVFTVEQVCSFTGAIEHVICCKLVVPKDNAVANSRTAYKGMGVKVPVFMEV